MPTTIEITVETDHGIDRHTLTRETPTGAAAAAVAYLVSSYAPDFTLAIREFRQAAQRFGIIPRTTTTKKEPDYPDPVTTEEE